MAHRELKKKSVAFASLICTGRIQMEKKPKDFTWLTVKKKKILAMIPSSALTNGSAPLQWFFFPGTILSVKENRTP